MIKIIKFIFLVAIIFGFWFFITLFGSNDREAAENFSIQSGQGVNQISRSLDEVGLIDSRFVFETWLWFRRSEGSIQAGVYNFPANISIYEISNILQRGPEDSQVAVTLLEGWDRNAIAKYLETSIISADDFEDLSSDIEEWRADYKFLSDAPAGQTLEGYIFPDTYFVDRETGANGLLIRALNNFDKKLSDEWRAEIQQQGKSIYEVITLASIIEREVPEGVDKKMVADVFLKRLKDNIGLQSDATINFITGKGLTRPSLDDLAIDSPYNTYKYRGLPPGPISNPGLDSIEAVIYPTANPYYYFLTTEDGTVIYSRTHDEHVQNKQKYLN